MEELNKAYYAIIPANVRYDKRLTANAKLLYGEITALCNEKGFCWAGNDYFASLYDVTKQTISTWIHQLKEYGYIETEMQYKEGSKEILNRYIYISEYPIKKNLNTPIKKNPKDNITLSNITFNNTDIYNKEKNIQKEKEEVRHEYGSEKNVLLTDSQYARLERELGSSFLLDCIEELSTSKAMRGYKYKRDDIAIRKWVIDAVKKKGSCASPNNKPLPPGLVGKNEFLIPEA